MVLSTFPERKVDRLPGRNPACVNPEKGSKISLYSQGGISLA
jgi:hypothetical protein